MTLSGPGGAVSGASAGGGGISCCGAGLAAAGAVLAGADRTGAGGGEGTCTWRLWHEDSSMPSNPSRITLQTKLFQPV
jgi:hypothetical protein